MTENDDAAKGIKVEHDVNETRETTNQVEGTEDNAPLPIPAASPSAVVESSKGVKRERDDKAEEEELITMIRKTKIGRPREEDDDRDPREVKQTKTAFDKERKTDHTGPRDPAQAENSAMGKRARSLTTPAPPDTTETQAPLPMAQAFVFSCATHDKTADIPQDALKILNFVQAFFSALCSTPGDNKKRPKVDILFSALGDENERPAADIHPPRAYFGPDATVIVKQTLGYMSHSKWIHDFQQQLLKNAYIGSKILRVYTILNGTKTAAFVDWELEVTDGPPSRARGTDKSKYLVLFHLLPTVGGTGGYGYRIRDLEVY